MAFGNFLVLKGLLIKESGTLTPKAIQLTPGGSASTTTSIVSSQTSDRTLTLPDGTDTLIGKATTDTLTNKTYDAEGTGNVLSNITNTHIKAAAGIVYSKLNLTGTIVNADISASAAIAYSKLNLATSIVNADVSASAAIAYSKLNLGTSIVNADISTSAAIAYSKLSLSNSIVNADISSSAAIAYSKLALTGTIVNADVSASAAIAYSKLNLATSIVNADISASAAIAYSKLNLATSIVNADVSASAAIAYSKLNLTGTIVNADIGASAAIAFSKLATLSSANILVGSAGNVATSVAVTGDVTISNAGVTAVGSNKITNAMLSTVATATFKGRTTASTGNVEDLTVTQATALLNAFVGDSGSGGTKGLVLAPASGDAAANKFLKADGTWSVPTGAGDVTGPASAVDGKAVVFNGSTGKIIKAFTPSAGAVIYAGASGILAETAVGTTGDILKSNGSSAPTWLTTLPIANGGTAGNSTPTAGGVAYGNGTAYAFTVAGTSGDILKSNGTGSAPTWITTIPIANGGTNGTGTPTAGGVAYGTGTAYAVTAAGTTGYFVTSAGASAPTFTAAANGTWTPTIAFGGNTDSSSINQAYYTRQGNMVNFAISMNIDPTAASAVTIRLTPPIASAFSDPSDCVGSIGVIATAGSSISKGAVNADAANDQINISFIPSGTGGDIYYIHGMYIIK